MTTSRPESWEYNRPHALWSLDAFNRLDDSTGSTPARRVRGYPIRALRYWFMDHLLRQEHARQRRPLMVCEVGVGDGALLRFVKREAAGNAAVRLPWIASWDAVSLCIDHSILQAGGYNRCLEANIEQDVIELTQQYDALVFLHVLEHLYEPEVALARLLPALKEGGILIGGAPTLPHVFRSVRERQLRKANAQFGHVSVISPHRIKHAAQSLDLSVELLTGAYALRATGSRLEQSRLWLRFNLIFGALCPNWPGELYWSLRKKR